MMLSAQRMADIGFDRASRLAALGASDAVVLADMGFLAGMLLAAPIVTAIDALRRTSPSRRALLETGIKSTKRVAMAALADAARQLRNGEFTAADVAAFDAASAVAFENEIITAESGLVLH